MEPEIIFSDDFVMTVSKPTGWIVNDAQTTKGQPTLQGWIAQTQKFPLAKNTSLRSGIVHRLDKETSGVLVVAKTEDTYFDLQKQFKERKTKKTYLALAHGLVNPKTGSIVAPVGRLPWRRDRFGVLAGGREAKTTYKVLELHQRKRGEQFTYIELSPETGRTHQLRIHLKHIGHPIVSDTFYAGRKTARKDRVWCPRLFLHAHKLVIIHPRTNKSAVFTSELPADLHNVFSHLEKLAS